MGGIVCPPLTFASQASDTLNRAKKALFHFHLPKVIFFAKPLSTLPTFNQLRGIQETKAQLGLISREEKNVLHDMKLISCPVLH